MNSNFLKRVFATSQFSAEYGEFLAHFSRLIEQDNESKIDFLAQMIAKLQASSELEVLDADSEN